MAAGGDYRIEPLSDAPDEALAERLVAFWTGHGALDEASARKRLADVLCVVFGPGDEIVGVNSAYAGTAPLVRRPFWMYRRFVLPTVPAELDPVMLKASYDELRRRFGERPSDPVGLCAVISDRAVIERYPDAVWDTGFVYVGYTDADEQVRIAYFEGADI